ncbi:MAG: hypothetical protein NZ701_11075, partial [Roseiflexus sp.]|nr:hypothetical protein [Roseiflexus sp.]
MLPDEAAEGGADGNTIVFPASGAEGGVANVLGSLSGGSNTVRPASPADAGGTTSVFPASM